MSKKNKIKNPINNKKSELHTSRGIISHLLRGGSWGTQKKTSTHRHVGVLNYTNKFRGFKVCLKKR
jgi:hypothetical protein